MKKKLAVIGGIAGGIVAALGTAALAFILVTGTGLSSADAYETKDLIVKHSTPVLIPGQQAMVPITVINPNPYAVKVVSIDSSVDVQGRCRIDAIAVSGSVQAAGDNAGSGGGGSVPPTGNSSVVPANGQITVHGRVFVGQDKTDTLSCKYTLSVTVKGELGNG